MKYKLSRLKPLAPLEPQCVFLFSFFLLIQNFMKHLFRDVFFCLKFNNLVYEENYGTLNKNI